jgi:putative hemolysin
MPVDPFHIQSSATHLSARTRTALVRPLLTWLLQLRTYRRLYQEALALPAGPFERRALEALKIRPAVADDPRTLIPTQGPLIVASNHPHGALDGLLLASVIRQQRPDVRVLTNYLLSRIPELEDLCLFVDPFGGRSAAVRSQAGLRAAHLWLKNDGALIVFPAGEVAHQAATTDTRLDSPWHSTIGRLALGTGAQVLPTFIDGRNSSLFYAAGRLHPALRTALLARELLNKRGASITVRIGAPLSARELGITPVDASKVTRSIRSAVETLGRTTVGRSPDIKKRRRSSDLAGADLIQSEIEQLANECRLVSSGAYEVYVADAGRIPATLHEIGRLREITYGAIGEGTGRQLDLDEFDEHYVHLFTWDRVRKQIVGAYRIGRTDRILATKGIAGLYTRTLFRYDERLIERLAPALELGRSFVRAEYQKNYNALLLLWKGIGQFVARNPQHRVLFGPVSISARYRDSSHDLLMAFLQQNRLDVDLAQLVEAMHPRVASVAPATVASASIEEVDRLIAGVEFDGKGVPILLRQYLKLNAKLLGFNVDPNFGDALDALMMVDLTTVDIAILNRYLGRTEAAAFLLHHRTQHSAHAA